VANHRSKVTTAYRIDEARAYSSDQRQELRLFSLARLVRPRGVRPTTQHFTARVASQSVARAGFFDFHPSSFELSGPYVQSCGRRLRWRGVLWRVRCGWIWSVSTTFWMQSFHTVIHWISIYNTAPISLCSKKVQRSRSRCHCRTSGRRSECRRGGPSHHC